MRHKTFLTMFEQTVYEVSGKIAVVDATGQLTYEELLTVSKRLGYALSFILHQKTQKPIMLFIDKGCKCLAECWVCCIAGIFMCQWMSRLHWTVCILLKIY